MDVRLTWTDCDEAGEYIVYVLSPRDLVSSPDHMDETVLHTYFSGVLKYPQSILVQLRDKQYLPLKTEVLLNKYRV